jgi:hypothetical protein
MVFPSRLTIPELEVEPADASDGYNLACCTMFAGLAIQEKQSNFLLSTTHSLDILSKLF